MWNKGLDCLHYVFKKNNTYIKFKLFVEMWEERHLNGTGAFKSVVPIVWGERIYQTEIIKKCLYNYGNICIKSMFYICMGI